jgi:hypothetical protein
MKKLVALAALAALCACNQKAAEPEAAPSEAAATAAAPAVQTMAERAGTYTYDDGKGTAGTSVMTPDGNYTDTSTDGNSVETGTWNVDEAGKVCFDPKGDDPKQPNRCYAVGEPGPDGTMDATADDGTVTKVKKTA